MTVLADQVIFTVWLNFNVSFAGLEMYLKYLYFSSEKIFKNEIHAILK